MDMRPRICRFFSSALPPIPGRRMGIFCWRSAIAAWSARPRRFRCACGFAARRCRARAWRGWGQSRRRGVAAAVRRRASPRRSCARCCASAASGAASSRRSCRSAPVTTNTSDMAWSNADRSGRSPCRSCPMVHAMVGGSCSRLTGPPWRRHGRRRWRPGNAISNATANAGIRVSDTRRTAWS